MSTVIETSGLGRQYRRKWALRDCTLAIPERHVVGLVGPNGAGKTTLLRLAAGMLAPTCGAITVLGERPGAGPGGTGPDRLRRPAHPRLRPDDGRRPPAARWLAEPRLGRRARAAADRAAGPDPKQRAGSLSGGQRAQLALTLALAKRPGLLILDEPLASLDPLARREFLQVLMEEVAAQGMSVVLSSHLVADLQRVCDYLIVLVASRVQIAGEVKRPVGLASPSVRAAPRAAQPPREPAGHHGKPHGQTEQPADPDRRAGPETQPGPSRRSAWTTWCSPTCARQAITRRPTRSD